jgi:hypothetical protein
MSGVGRCPHCGGRIRPIRVLRVSRSTPYLCPVCGKASVIPPRDGARAVVGWVVAVGIVAAALGYLQVPRVVLFLFCASAALMFPLIFARSAATNPNPRVVDCIAGALVPNASTRASLPHVVGLTFATDETHGIPGIDRQRDCVRGDECDEPYMECDFPFGERGKT